jgi:hypothetical protein
MKRCEYGPWFGCAEVEQLTHDPKFKGSKSSCSATGIKKPNVIKLFLGIGDYTLANYPNVLGANCI